MSEQELQKMIPDCTPIQKLEKRICELIKSNYDATYTGYLEVEHLNPGYKLSIGIPSYMMPSTIATDIDDEEEFLKFIDKELKTRNYLRQEYYKVIRTSNNRPE